MKHRTRHVSETRSGEQHNYLTLGAVAATTSRPNPIIRRRVRRPHLRRRRRRRLRGVEEDAAVEVRGRGEAGAAVAEERGVEPKVQPARGRGGVPGHAAIPSGDGVEGRREVGPQRRGREAALPPPRRRLAHPPAAGGRGHVIEVHRGEPVALTRRTCAVDRGLTPLRERDLGK